MRIGLITCLLASFVASGCVVKARPRHHHHPHPYRHYAVGVEAPTPAPPPFTPPEAE